MTDATTPPAAKTAADGTDSQDLLSRLAGITPDSQAGQILQQRGKIVAGVQNSHALFFSPEADGLSLQERAFAALIISHQGGSTALTQYYTDLLRAQPDSHDLLHLATQGGAASSARLAAIRHFVQQVDTEPASADRTSLEALSQAGLDVPSIVLLAQLVGYVSFQLRLLAGWQTWAQSATQATAVGLPPDDDTFVHPANLPPPGQPLRRNGFTSDTLGWAAWLPVLDPDLATPAQSAVLDASHPKARSSDFYLLLALQPAILQERSAVFNAIMYAPGGLSRPERELATAVVSRLNRCVYCLSVHAQRFEQLTKRNDVIAQLFDDPQTAGTNARERAIVHLSTILTNTPAAVVADTFSPAQAAGLSALEILDAIHASALFAWANRLMLNLGESVQP